MVEHILFAGLIALTVALWAFGLYCAVGFAITTDPPKS